MQNLVNTVPISYKYEKEYKMAQNSHSQILEKLQQDLQYLNNRIIEEETQDKQNNYCVKVNKDHQNNFVSRKQVKSLSKRCKQSLKRKPSLLEDQNFRNFHKLFNIQYNGINSTIANTLNQYTQQNKAHKNGNQLIKNQQQKGQMEIKPGKKNQKKISNISKNISLQNQRNLAIKGKDQQILNNQISSLKKYIKKDKNLIVKQQEQQNNNKILNSENGCSNEGNGEIIMDLIHLYLDKAMQQVQIYEDYKKNKPQAQQVQGGKNTSDMLKKTSNTVKTKCCIDKIRVTPGKIKNNEMIPSKLSKIQPQYDNNQSKHPLETSTLISKQYRKVQDCQLQSKEATHNNSESKEAKVKNASFFRQNLQNFKNQDKLNNKLKQEQESKKQLLYDIQVDTNTISAKSLYSNSLQSPAVINLNSKHNSTNESNQIKDLGNQRLTQAQESQACIHSIEDRNMVENYNVNKLENLKQDQGYSEEVFKDNKLQNKFKGKLHDQRQLDQNSYVKPLPTKSSFADSSYNEDVCYHVKEIDHQEIIPKQNNQLHDAVSNQTHELQKKTGKEINNISSSSSIPTKNNCEKSSNQPVINGIRSRKASKFGQKILQNSLVKKVSKNEQSVKSINKSTDSQRLSTDSKSNNKQNTNQNNGQLDFFHRISTQGSISSDTKSANSYLSHNEIKDDFRGDLSSSSNLSIIQKASQVVEQNSQQYNNYIQLNTSHENLDIKSKFKAKLSQDEAKSASTIQEVINTSSQISTSTSVESVQNSRNQISPGLTLLRSSQRLLQQTFSGAQKNQVQEERSLGQLQHQSTNISLKSHNPHEQEAPFKHDKSVTNSRQSYQDDFEEA